MIFWQCWYIIVLATEIHLFLAFYGHFFALHPFFFLSFEKLNLSNCQDASLRPILTNTSGLDFFFLLRINSTHNIYLYFPKIYKKILGEKKW